MQGKTVLVTGANTGIGWWTACGLAARGATVLLHGRSRDKVLRAVAAVRDHTGNPDVHPLVADFAALDDVRALALAVLERQRLDVLVNNAGLVLSRRTLTGDGFEAQLQINHLAPYLFTRLLLDHLRSSAPARIVTVSSRAHARGEIDWGDLQSERSYRPLAVYGRTKLMNLLFTRALDRRLAGSGVTANALHPGVVRSEIGGSGDLNPVLGALWKVALRFGGISPRRGAETSIHLATSPEVAGTSGEYFDRSRPARSASRARDPEAAERLWQESETMVTRWLDRRI